jgi:hypothetical protein
MIGGAGHRTVPIDRATVTRSSWRTFIAFWYEALAICASVCFHEVSKASTEEVHMKIHSTNGQKSVLCASAAAGNHALLG